METAWAMAAGQLADVPALENATPKPAASCKPGRPWRVGCQQAGQRLLGDAGLLQRRHACLRRSATGNPTTTQRGWISSSSRLAGRTGMPTWIGALRRWSLGNCACQPRGVAFDAHRFAGQQVGDEALAQLQVRQA
jgi:hypothetical protein